MCTYLFANSAENFSPVEREEYSKLLKPQTDLLRFRHLESAFKKYVKSTNSVLVIAEKDFCSISESLHDDGVKNITHLFPTDTNIKQLKKKNLKKGRNLNFEKGTIRDIKSEDGSYNVILDISPPTIYSNQLNEQNGEKNHPSNEYFENVGRILEYGGRYLYVTNAAESKVESILSYFKDSWFIRAQEVEINIEPDKTHYVYSPLFMFVMTKLKMKLPKPIFEISLGTEKVKRVQSGDDVKKAILEVWNFAWLQCKLRNSINATEISTAQLWDSPANLEQPRYCAAVVDIAEDDESDEKLVGKYGVFIVPQGRELGWLFASEKGRKKLAGMAGYRRLCIVTMQRGHYFENIEVVKAELSTRVMQLAPPGVKANSKVPFLTVGEDVGHREVVYDEGTIESGGYTVEDVRMDDGFFYRRLIFKSDLRIIQTESRLLKGSDSKLAKIDHYHLAFGFHKAIIAALAYIEDFDIDGECNILLIGLGGGALPCFISKIFPQFNVTCVDLDMKVIEIAKRWFDFVEDDHLKVINEDGIMVMKDAFANGVSGLYHAIIYDVNTEEDAMGMSAPPPSFLEKRVLDDVINLLSPSGVLIVNLACREENIKQKVANDSTDSFSNVYMIDKEAEDVNVVLCCLSPKRKSEPCEKDLLSKASNIETKVKQIREVKSDRNVEPLGLGDALEISVKL